MVAHIILRDERGDVLEVESAAGLEGTEAPRQPAVIVPPFSVAVSPDAGILPLGDKSLHLSTQVTLGVPPAPGVKPSWSNVGSTLRVPQGWKIGDVTRPATSVDSLTENFAVDPGALASGKLYRLTAIATQDHKDYTETFRPIGYPGLTLTNMYTPASYKATALDVHTAPGLKIAYLPGTGDDVPVFLANLGVTPTLISIQDLVPEKLAQFDEVVLGGARLRRPPRARRPRLQAPRGTTPAPGGVVIVQYNTARYGAADAPYSITVPGDHAHDVIVEAQPVTVLVPSAPLLTLAQPHHLPPTFRTGSPSTATASPPPGLPSSPPCLKPTTPIRTRRKAACSSPQSAREPTSIAASPFIASSPRVFPAPTASWLTCSGYAKNPNRN